MIVTEATVPLPSTATKRQLIEQAFNECALNGWEYDITPEEKDTALTRLDGLMNSLKGRGLDLSYNFPAAIGQGDMDDMLGCPDAAFEALAILLAERLCPTMGKSMSMESRRVMFEAAKTLRAVAPSFAPTVTFPHGTPLGAGYRMGVFTSPFSRG